VGQSGADNRQPLPTTWGSRYVMDPVAPDRRGPTCLYGSMSVLKSILM